MIDCWASSLGGCAGKTSREHVVSKCLFVSPEVAVQGFHWCKDQPKTVGIESLTAKILCQEHNSQLSPLDSAAGAAFESLRQQTKLSNERQKFSPKIQFKVERFFVDARLLERWFLKTLINFTNGSDLLIGPHGAEKGTPPIDLVRICYGFDSFQNKAGMYVAANAGMTLDMTDTVVFSPLIKDGVRVLGGFFEFRGIKFFLALMPEGLSYPMNSIPRINPNWIDAKLLRPFKKINAKHGKYLTHTVEFRW